MLPEVWSCHHFDEAVVPTKLNAATNFLSFSFNA